MTTTPGWQALFKRAGFSPAAARAAARSRDMRDAALAFNLQLMPAGMTPPKMCVDVGANSGEWSAGALRLFSGVALHAFEPDPSSAKLLHDRIGASPNVTCHGIAAGAAAGTAPFHRYANSGGVLNSLTRLIPGLEAFYGAPYQEAIEIRVARLDDILPQALPRPLVVNIDVQGAEDAVFDGGRRVLGAADVVIVEALFVPMYDNGTNFWSTHQRLTSEFGLVLFNLANMYRAPNGRVNWAEAVYVRPGAAVGAIAIGDDIMSRAFADRISD
jgi:FkbM family methyltransferase